MKANQVYFNGNLGKDAEVKSTANTSYTRFSVCHTKSWKVKDEWKKKEIWANVLIWKAMPNLKKGNEVLIIGELDYNVWEDKQKVKHFDLSIKANEVILLPKQEKSQSQQPETDFPY